VFPTASDKEYVAVAFTFVYGPGTVTALPPLSVLVIVIVTPSIVPVLVFATVQVGAVLST
jgi:hypothetical protein